MARRSGMRPPRTKNSYIMAASAVVRALESSSPSRLATARLLAEALLLYGRPGANVKTDPDSARPGSRAAEAGARALANSAVHAMMVLACRGGTVSRRAYALLEATGEMAGAAAMLGAAERARTHMGQLRPQGIDESDLYMTAAFASAAGAVAYASRCDRAGRHCAEESVRALLAVRGCRTIRGIGARNAGVLLESFPNNFAPDARLINAVLESLFNSCSPGAVSKATAPDAGVALLAAAIAPRLFSRPQQAEKLLRCLSATLPVAPGDAKGAWAAALVRVAIVARTARVKRPVRPEFEKRVKKDPASRSGPPVPDVQLFETVTVTVARVAGLASARAGATLALIAALRCWDDNIPDVGMIARVVALLAPEVSSVAAASMLRDALCEAVIKRLPPSMAYGCVQALSELAGVHGRVSDALVVDLCSVLVRKYGAAAVVAPDAGDVDEESTTPALFDDLVTVARTALASNFAAGRLAGVRLVTALAAAIPYERVSLLTSILQGLRIGDLRLDGADGVGLADLVSPRIGGSSTSSRPNSVAAALAAVLGNAVGLAALVEECACCQWTEEPVPSAVLRQVAGAALRLMRPLPPPQESDKYRERVATAVRRRAGWAVFAALARAEAVEMCVPGGIHALCRLWRDDLRNTDTGAPGDIIRENEEILAEAAMRCAALAALAACLRHEPSDDLAQLAPHFVGAAAARVARLRNPDPDVAPSREIQTEDSAVLEDALFYRASLNTTRPLADGTTPDNSAKLSHALLHRAESVQVARCAVLAPPRGAHASLAYHVVAALATDAATALSEDSVQQPGVVAALLGAVAKTPDTTFAHRRVSLATLRAYGFSECANVSKSPDEPPQNLAWICSTEGVELPVAEEALVIAARAIASLIVAALPDPADEVPHAFANSPFADAGPTASAAIALAVAARIPAAALAANGRVLAALQVLVARALRETKTPLPSAQASAPESHWAGTCIDAQDAPGAVLLAMAGGHADRPAPLLYNCPGTRTVAISQAARTVTAAAFRVLAEKGGQTMWTGLVRSACNPLKQNTAVAVSAADILGALLALGDDDKIIEEAVVALATGLEEGSPHVQAAAARALPVCASTARLSERIVTALTNAWAFDDGTQDYDRHPALWETCLERIANRVLRADERTPTRDQPYVIRVYAPRIVPALAFGARRVLDSCAEHRSAVRVRESTLLGTAELCVDLLHWEEPEARSAGLDGLVAIWRVRMRRNTNTPIPITQFSIRTLNIVGSSAGLFLEDVIYDALQSGSECLATSASRAVAFMIARVGARTVAKNFTRMPEVLCKAAADGNPYAQQLLEVLANADAPDPDRIKYWIGLTRSVVLGMKRLNAGVKENWDADERTNALAVRIMRISISASLAGCRVSRDEEPCGVLGCVKETLAALVAVVKKRPAEALVLAEATAAIQTFAAAAQCREPTQRLGQRAVDALNNAWPTVAEVLSDLLVRKHAHKAVQLAADCSSHWLLAAPFLDVEEKTVRKLAVALAGREPAGIARRFEYLEKSDTCGSATVAAVSAALGRVVATRALHARLFGRHHLDTTLERTLPALKNVASATLADYATLAHAGADEHVSAALAFPGPSPERLSECVLPYIPILATAACALAPVDASKNVENISWLDDAAPAVEALRGVEGACDIGRLALAYCISLNRSHIFDPANTFKDVAHYAAMQAVHALPLHEQDTAAALVDKKGRSVENIQFDGIETFGVLCQPASAVDKPTPQPERVLDQNQDDEPPPVVVDETPVKMKESRQVVADEDADGRLLKMPLDNSLNAARHRAPGNEMPAAVIAFDDLGAAPVEDGPDGEAADPFASVATEALIAGVDISDKPLNEEEEVDDNGDTLETKPDINEPAEPTNLVQPSEDRNRGAGEVIRDDDADGGGGNTQGVENMENQEALDDTPRVAEVVKEELREGTPVVASVENTETLNGTPKGKEKVRESTLVVPSMNAAPDKGEGKEHDADENSPTPTPVVASENTSGKENKQQLNGTNGKQKQDEVNDDPNGKLGDNLLDVALDNDDEIPPQIDNFEFDDSQDTVQ